MKIKSALLTILLTLLLGLQACTAPTTTSERYRLLTAPMMDSVETGMTQAEAWRILGEPWSSVVYPLKPSETYYNWKWRNQLDEGMYFSVVLDSSNRVIRTETWRDMHDRKNVSAESRV